MTKESQHYDDKYFAWQVKIGEFGGWANVTKFSKFISKTDVVVDFGCGGGYLLKNLECSKKIGIEINPHAGEMAKRNGVIVYPAIGEIPDESADVIISNHALEHTMCPLEQIKALRTKLRKGGKLILVVPCESISKKYKPDDINQHLYSWSPMCLGNLVTEAGFELIESKAYMHKWPPMYIHIARFGGRAVFDLISCFYARIERSWFQVRVIAIRPQN